jgi:uncharacterized RDD family membrane protein YckC
VKEYLEKEIRVVTPEQVQLQFQTAGIGSRALAHILDGLLLLLANAVLVLFLILGSKYVWDGTLTDFSEYAVAITIIVLILLNVGYFICTEAYMGGQTVGKKIGGLRVLQDNGQQPTLLSIIIRNLFRLLDLLPMGYFLGAVVMMFSSKDKRLGDMVAGTIVIVELQGERLKRRKAIEKSLAAWQDRLPKVEVDELGKQSLTLDDWQLLQTWMERSTTMSQAKLGELSAPIARHLAEKLNHPAELTIDPPAYLTAVYLELRSEWEY